MPLIDAGPLAAIAVAEERRLDRIFTLDADVRVYRLPRGRAFTIIP